MHKASKLHIREVIDPEGILPGIKKKFGYAMRHSHKRIEELADTNVLNEIKKRFGLVDVEMRSIKTKVICDMDGFNEIKEKERGDLEDMKKDLSKKKKSLEQTENGTEGRKKIVGGVFKLDRKINKKERGLQRSAQVFGRKSNLQEITRLFNKINSEKDEHELNRLKRRLDKVKKTFQDQRIGNVYLVGEANQKGNRFFEFNLSDGEVVFKPRKGQRIVFKVTIGKNRRKEMKKLEEMAKDKRIAITVEIMDDHLSLMFDSQILRGFAVDTQGRNEEVKKIKASKLTKIQQTAEIKSAYKLFYQKQEETMLIGKLPNRFIGIDINPGCIGYSIIDKKRDGSFTIVEVGSFHLGEELTKKLGLRPSDPRQKKQNNKRKHELTQILLQIFAIAKHHRCFGFVVEELDFKQEEKSKEANRQTKNIWHRQMISNMIKKKTDEEGMRLVEVNPVYSSFIGNVMWNVFDAAAASIEIARRGAFKFEKDRFYPNIDGTILRTLAEVAGDTSILEDVALIKDVHWKDLFAVTTQKVEFRYRRGEETNLVSSSSLKSHRTFVRHNSYRVPTRQTELSCAVLGI